jgi:hypothetical protein
MTTVKNMPPELANQFDVRFVIWIHQYIVDVLNSLGVDVSGINTNLGTIEATVNDLPTNLSDLTDSEIQQLQNIDSSTISAIAWLALSKLSFSDDRTYVTNVSTQRAIDRTSDVIIESTTVSNTTDETTIFTASIGANDLKAGNVLKFCAGGELSNDSASDDITVRGYLGTTLLGTFNPAIGNVTDAHWDVEAVMTVRSIGVTGSVAWHAHFYIDDSETEGLDISTVDTTASEDFTVTVEWDNAKAGNTISTIIGYMEYKN